MSGAPLKNATRKTSFFHLLHSAASDLDVRLSLLRLPDTTPGHQRVQALEEGGDHSRAAGEENRRRPRGRGRRRRRPRQPPGRVPVQAHPDRGPGGGAPEAERGGAVRGGADREGAEDGDVVQHLHARALGDIH